MADLNQVTQEIEKAKQEATKAKQEVEELKNKQKQDEAMTDGIPGLTP